MFSSNSRTSKTRFQGNSKIFISHSTTTNNPINDFLSALIRVNHSKKKKKKPRIFWNYQVHNNYRDDPTKILPKYHHK